MMLQIYRDLRKFMEKKNPHLEAFMMTALSYHGQWYRWGGDDPAGFDCSGLVVECLKAIGELAEAQDGSANDIWGMYRHKEIERPREGALVFYLDKNNRAYHVGICLNEIYCLTADGGDETTTSVERAREQNAFIKIRKISKRSSTRRYAAVINQ